jgi:hypothetical protein
MEPAADDRGVTAKVNGAAALLRTLLLLITVFPLLGAAESVQQGMRVYQTDHYRLFTDVDEDLARDLSKRLDAMYDEYARRLNAFGQPTDKLFDVHVFSKRIDYMRFIDDRVPNSGGVFIPARNVLAAYLEGQGRDALRRTLQHEAFHQFAHGVISDKLPPWINEGIAQLFEEGIWTGSRFIIEQVPPRRIRQLQLDMQKRTLVPFDEFIEVDHQSWARTMRDRETGATQYNQSWAMVHFLVYATKADGTPAYRQRFFDMLKSIQAGTEPKKAFLDHFGDNFAGFQKRFVEYANRLAPSREATYAENVEVLADMMIELKENEQYGFDSFDRFKTHVREGGYQLHYTKGLLRWSSNPDVSLYFQDLEGRPLPATQMGFVQDRNSPLPALLARPPGGLEYKTRFYTGVDGKIEREILVRGY